MILDHETQRLLVDAFTNRVRNTASCEVVIDEPFQDDGTWWIDFRNSNRCAVAQWSIKDGWGVSVPGPDDVPFEVKPTQHFGPAGVQAADRVVQILRGK